MARRRAVSITFYAINGRGLGHLSRLLCIARRARELCEALELEADFSFVTTSEGCSIAEGFPVYKLPSKTALSGPPRVRERHVQHAKLVVSNLIAAQNPDLLVLDTVPYGAFQELAFIRSYARATAYVYRHQDPRVRTSDLVQRHLELFDRIVVPDEESRSEEYPLPRAARQRVAFVGPIHGFDPAHAWQRDRVRAHFGVEEGQRLIYVSAGGGGDGRPTLERLVRAIGADPRNFVLAGYGPLHRDVCVHSKNVIPLLDGGASRFFFGIDAAISAAGENSFQELCAARVPSLFFAQDKGLDRQDVRIERGLAAGTIATLDPNVDAILVRARLEDLLTGQLGASIRSALAARKESQGALAAAVELLSVCASLPETGIDRAQLLEAAAWRRDAAPELARDFVRHARAYRGWRRSSANAPEIASEQDANGARWWSGKPDANGALAAGAELEALRDQSGADDADWQALIGAFATQPSPRSHALKLQELFDTLNAIDRQALGALAQIARNQGKSTLRDKLLQLRREADA